MSKNPTLDNRPAPPLPAEPDREYQTRIDAARATWAFKQPLSAPRNRRKYTDDLPLLGEKPNQQEELF